MTIEPMGGISPFDAIREADDRGEFWRGRRLMDRLDYYDWRNFLRAIRQARAACAVELGELAAQDHFVETNAMVSTGSGAMRSVPDYRLSRMACYLTAMRGDASKAAIAAALIYFAARTRESEVNQHLTPALPRDYEQALVALLSEVREKKALERKVSELEPAAAAWERLASANGDFSVRVAANILNRDPNIQTGQNRLFAIIRGMDMVSKGDIPYAKHSDHLRQKPGTPYEHPKTHEKTVGEPQLRVTVRGLQYLHKRLGGVVAISRHVQAELEFGGEADAA